MKKVIITSTNPVKVRAVLEAFKVVFPGEEFVHIGHKINSGVPNQPIGNSETFQGAVNRVDTASKLIPDADFWVGIEGGVEKDGNNLFAFAWVIIKDPFQTGKARSASFQLPPQIAAMVETGKELGEADDIVFSRTNSKQENGAVGILTGDIIDRQKLYEPAVILALIPFLHPEHYPNGSPSAGKPVPG